MFYIIFGVVCIVGGLPGLLTLRGTDTGLGAAVLGLLALGWGIFLKVKGK
jgi:hypothetical protein